MYLMFVSDENREILKHSQQQFIINMTMDILNGVFTMLEAMQVINTF